MKRSECSSCGAKVIFENNWVCSCLFSDKEKELLKGWILTKPKYYKINNVKKRKS